jgi:hypothetical protein
MPRAKPRKPAPKNHHLDKFASTLIAAGDGPDADQLLETREVAEWLRVSYQWLTIGRVRKYGPPFIKVTDRRVVYRRGDVLNWLASRTRGAA